MNEMPTAVSCVMLITLAAVVAMLEFINAKRAEIMTREPSEQEIQREIMDFLEARGVLCWRVHMGGVRVKGGRVPNKAAGFPDLCAIVERHLGRLVAIEVKKPSDRKLDPKQVEWKQRLEAAGCLHVVATSIEDVRAALSTQTAGVGARAH